MADETTGEKCDAALARTQRQTAQLEWFERLARVVREWLMLIVLCLVAVLVLPSLPKLASRLTQAQVTDLELPGGVKLKLQQAEGQLAGALRANAPQAGPSDAVPSSAASATAEALDALRSVSSATLGERTGWIYAGAVQSGRWLANPLSLQEMPENGQTLRLPSDTFLRTSAPVSHQDDWKLGEASAVLSVGQTVRVTQTRVLSARDGRQWLWLEVSPQ